MIKFRGKRKDNGEWVEGYLCSPNTISVLETEVYLNITNRVIYEVIPETVGMFTGLTDKNGKEIYGSIPINGEMSKGGDRCVCEWLAELGITELDCIATGNVEYMSDGITAAWFVEFDKPYTRYISDEGKYTEERIILIQPAEDMSIGFEVLSSIYEKGEKK